MWVQSYYSNLMSTFRNFQCLLLTAARLMPSKAFNAHTFDSSLQLMYWLPAMGTRFCLKLLLLDK